MNPALTQLIKTRPLDVERFEAFVRDNDVPVVDGNGVVFLYRGEADEVRLRHFIYGLPTSRPFRRVEDTDLWYLQMDLPERSRIEYKIERTIGGDTEWIMDPLNPHTARDPFGANSVCHGRGYEIPDWSLPDDDARPGEWHERGFRSRVFGDVRRLRVYLPARFRRSRRYRLLVVHDGSDYIRFSSLKVVLDNLIHRQEIAPLVVAFSDPVDRLVEYGADERQGKFLVEELLPEMESAYPLIQKPRARALLGASFGAVATLHAAWKHPGYFGRLLLQSGSFAFSDIGPQQRGPAFEPVAEFVNAFREAPGRPANRVFVSCGTYEPLIYENRSIVPLLQSTGMAVRYVEARDGHNWENWRDRMREGLSWCFPGALWMVYE